jgi:transposase
MSYELQTLIASLFPPACPVSVTTVAVTQDAVRLQLTASAPTACCPACAVPSSAVHSRYQRHLSDLPWGARAVHLQLSVRKFVCRQPACARRIFTERLPELVAPSARKTTRLITVLRAIGLALGGLAGARLAARLRLSISGATLLCLVRAAPMPSTPTLQAVGVDEWAWRRGRRFGTIVVDLASHRVVELLPERSAEAVGAWLARHPSITVVCRDRSSLYADAIGRGAPEAVQVVDRFHLVDNLRKTLEAYLQNQRAALQAAAACTAQVLTPPGSLVPTTPMYQGRRQRLQTPQGGSEGVARQHRHTPWVTIYETLHTLHAQGMPIATIARQLGISRPTVYAYLRRKTPPGPKRPQFHGSARVLTPYVPYLIRRWRESGANSAELWREIRALGYTHSARTVCRFITTLRRASEAGLAAEAQASPYTRPSGPSPRAVSFTLVCPAAKRSPAAEIYVEQLCQLEPGVARAYALSQAFLVLVRERRGDALEAWMAEATDSGIAEVARFARGLQADLQAIQAGLTLEWSNGVTEGQIHRLKLVKRQGYGRAGFALLRQRVLHAA